MSIKIGVLDQSPIHEGETAAQALRNTIKLAQRVEELGFTRFWVSEHHDSEQVAGSSPEVLISHLLARTERIKVGSGGVMLQHYSPYKVAENFNVLSSLAPGRVDLGIGRAPGGLPKSTQALQRNVHDAPSLEEKIDEASRYIHNIPSEEGPLAGLQANPIPEIPADIYVLGTSTDSAGIAARLGLPYVFSQFINSNEQVALESFRTYRESFDYSYGREPKALFALSVIVADTSEEAAELAGEHKLYKIHLASGKTATVGTLESAEEFGKQSGEEYTIEATQAQINKGNKDEIYAVLTEIQAKYQADELIVTTGIRDIHKRVRSFELLHEAFAGLPVQS